MNSLRRSPKYGAFTAATFRVLRMALMTRAVRASPSMSSAMIRVGLPDSAIFSSSGRKSGREEIFSRTSSTCASSRIACWASTSVMKYGDR